MSHWLDVSGIIKIQQSANARFHLSPLKMFKSIVPADYEVSGHTDRTVTGSLYIYTIDYAVRNVENDLAMDIAKKFFEELQKCKHIKADIEVGIVFQL